MKRKPGRPPKKGKPHHRLTVTISPDSWAWLQTKDNKSRAVDDALIVAARLAPPPRGGRMGE